MSTRRHFLKLGAAASAVATGAIRAGTAEPMPDAVMALLYQQPLYKVLADARHATSLTFAAKAEQHGHAVHLLGDGDVTAFWYHELHVIWQQQPQAMAGLTEAGPLFCLEQLARQYGLRVVQRVLVPDRPGLVAWVIAPRAAA